MSALLQDHLHALIYTGESQLLDLRTLVANVAHSHSLIKRLAEDRSRRNHFQETDVPILEATPRNNKPSTIFTCRSSDPMRKRPSYDHTAQLIMINLSNNTINAIFPRPVIFSRRYAYKCLALTPIT